MPRLGSAQVISGAVLFAPGWDVGCARVRRWRRWVWAACGGIIFLIAICWQAWMIAPKARRY